MMLKKEVLEPKEENVIRHQKALMDATYCAVTAATQREGKGELNAANVNSIGAVMSNVRSALEMYKFLHVTEVGGSRPMRGLHFRASTNHRPSCIHTSVCVRDVQISAFT